jgi:hypothetical protein
LIFRLPWDEVRLHSRLERAARLKVATFQDCGVQLQPRFARRTAEGGCPFDKNEGAVKGKLLPSVF